MDIPTYFSGPGHARYNAKGMGCGIKCCYIWHYYTHSMDHRVPGSELATCEDKDAVNELHESDFKFLFILF